MRLTFTNIRVDDFEQEAFTKFTEPSERDKYGIVVEEMAYAISAAATVANDGNDDLSSGDRIISSASLSFTMADNHAGSLILSLSFAPVTPESDVPDEATTQEAQANIGAPVESDQRGEDGPQPEDIVEPEDES